MTLVVITRLAAAIGEKLAVVGEGALSVG